jgi:hypothetical protein
MRARVEVEVEVWWDASCVVQEWGEWDLRGQEGTMVQVYETMVEVVGVERSKK